VRQELEPGQQGPVSGVGRALSEKVYLADWACAQVSAYRACRGARSAMASVAAPDRLRATGPAGALV
jgi:hypothetical protein